MGSGIGESVEFGPFRLNLKHRKLFSGDEEIQLGSRAMDLLLALGRNKGELVSKHQLVEAAWPNTFVHESNLKVTIASLRRTLREWSDSREYINTVVGRGYWLGVDTRLDNLAEAQPLLPAALPEIGTLIGRDAEISELRGALASHRLTTIAGAGGVGKTTLALAAAQLFEDEGGGPVTFVDLGRVASEQFVPASLLAALGISSGGIDSMHAIVSILEKRKGLLLLDTCEHVLSAVAHICDLVLANAIDVRILTTSRQVLRARDENVLWLAPLDVPPADEASTAQSVLRYSAPQLLAARAFEKAGYLMSDQDAQAVAEICRRLDGAPLALELVSSRFAGRSAATVLEELADRFRNLRRHRPGIPLRQQTLLATLEWSYALLNEDEATVLRAISFFAGSFDMDAVTRITAHVGLASAFDAVTGLRAKSMLSVELSFGKLRYRLLDSTRAFASELLKSEGELPAVAASHAQLQLEILTRAGAELSTMSARKWHALYSGQADDLRKALDWALHGGADPLLGIQLVAAGLPLWHELSLAEECRFHCEAALLEFERIGCEDMTLKQRLVVGLATVTTYLAGDGERTLGLFQTAVQLARDTQDAGAECRALGAIAMFNLIRGDDNVMEVLHAMREAAVRTNDRSALWEHELLCSVWDVHRCEFPAAYRRLHELRSAMRGQPEGAVPRFHIHQRINIEVQLGALCWLMGEPGQAVSVIEHAAHDAIETGHGLTLIHCLSRGIIFTLLESGHVERARFYTDLLKRTIYRHGMAVWIPIADCYSACIDALSGLDGAAENLRVAFDPLSKGTVQFGHQSYYAALANAMVTIGEFNDASRVVDMVFASGAQRWVLPEMLRLRAAIEKSSGQVDKATITLREALQAADDIGAYSWKLRAAIDLARLMHAQGSLSDARQVLAPVYERFADGFATSDLTAARALLKESTEE